MISIWINQANQGLFSRSFWYYAELQMVQPDKSLIIKKLVINETVSGICLHSFQDQKWLYALLTSKHRY